jgi:hypothetical protein
MAVRSGRQEREKRQDDGRDETRGREPIGIGEIIVDTSKSARDNVSQS